MPLPGWEIGTCDGSKHLTRKGISGVRLSHTPGADSRRRSTTRIWCRRRGWCRCWRWPSGPGCGELADEHLTVPTDKGANAGLKVASLVAGMVAGADSIDDMALLRHGGMGRVFAQRLRALDAGVVPARVHLRARRASSTRSPPGSCSRWRASRACSARRASRAQPRSTRGEYALVDVDDTVVEVHGHAKQGAGFGYNRVRGLNALLATLTHRRPRRR